MLRSEEKGKLVGWLYLPPSERTESLAGCDFECAGCGAITSRAVIERRPACSLCGDE